ncbi:M15 family metallopeptidase [Nesterenkonia flava]|uniref:M15 family metallopeptidase n=1 Tax=Nesterenkonia flava TaxID=469799 RepID=A0ABU1FQJ7_9MICC|nr:M15 family metallopeptidase [Nesterenkonia flava]MDR5710916.1 M15 family metallopeptidase [Nesterenkonia flava]
MSVPSSASPRAPRPTRAARRRQVLRRRRTVALLLIIPVFLLLGWGVATGVSALWGALTSDDASSEGPDQTRDAAEASGTETENAGSPGETASDAEPEPAEDPEPERASDPSWDPESIHVLVNRQNPFEPMDWEPEDLVVPDVPQYGPQEAMSLREEAADALEELFAAGVEEDMVLGFVSGYRSFDYQVQIYSARHAEVGTEDTDRYMSRPGYSEHQTGLAADVISIANPDCMLGECFADTPEGQWVAENAHTHGFIVRYLEDMEHITGYPYEPWHLRYVGVETATEVYEAGLTLEEYWDQPPAPDYEDPEPHPDHLLHGPAPLPGA